MSNILKRITTILVSLVILLFASFFIWTRFTYNYDETAKIILESGSFTQFEDGLVSKQNSDSAIIFYPGAKVEPESYLPLLDEVSKSTGFDVYLVDMPFNLAMFGVDKVKNIIDQTDYENYYLMGHSLGGAMASIAAEKYENEISGLILLASYLYSDYSVSKTLTIYGDLDKGKDSLEYQENVKIIEGGSHASFGNYGEQSGYLESTITRNDQQNITAKYIDEFLN